MKVHDRLKLVFCLFLMLCFLAVTSAAASERFQKMDAQGNALPVDAQDWAIVYDVKNGLYWEVKSVGKSIHSNEATYAFTNVEADFIVKINEEKFGGQSDWRLPTTGELAGLKVKKKDTSEALIDLQYFPATMPAKYMSLGWCGANSEYQEESIKFGPQKVSGAKYVRAVRGKPLE